MATSQSFDYSMDFANINFRKHPELYRVGKGEQGVLVVEPYKSEILPHWKFKTPDLAKQSSEIIVSLFNQYKQQNDFIGMDMARKFLQMGYTRARRYANHKSGKKYKGPVPQNKKGQSGAHGRQELPKETDEEKARSAVLFYAAWQKIKEDEIYKQSMKEHEEKYK